MVCTKCGSDKFVCVNLPDNQNTTIVISAGKEITREGFGAILKNISVCKDCGYVNIENNEDNVE